MGKILLNPENGAEIKNFVFKNEHFYDAKEGQSFMPGMIVRIDDDELADFMLETWRFLEEMNPEEAKVFMESKEDLRCDKCEFKTKFQPGFKSHQRKHERENQLDDLGIPVIAPKKVKEKDPASIQDMRRKDWEAADRQAGLDGEGLTIDREV